MLGCNVTLNKILSDHVILLLRYNIYEYIISLLSLVTVYREIISLPSLTKLNTIYSHGQIRVDT